MFYNTLYRVWKRLKNEVVFSNELLKTKTANSPADTAIVFSTVQSLQKCFDNIRTFYCGKQAYNTKQEEFSCYLKFGFCKFSSIIAKLC